VEPWLRRGGRALGHEDSVAHHVNRFANRARFAKMPSPIFKTGASEWNGKRGPLTEAKGSLGNVLISFTCHKLY
jgi:hypothetical protein